MRKIILLAVCFALVSSVLYIPTTTEASEIQKHQQLLNESIATKNWGNAAVYSTRIAEEYDRNGQYDAAVPYYEDAAFYWTKYGEPTWGVQYIRRADEIRTEVDIYVEKPTNINKKLAKFEPVSGTYLGLWLAGVKDHVNPDLVKDNYGKNHAMYLQYVHWNMVFPGTSSYFPLGLAEKAKNNGSALQVALEPLGGLDQVVDNQYLRQFAKEARESGVPVFLRFASEMNGDWVPWYGDPEKYKEKFKLVHDIMEQEAPNVAMVWSPNFFPYDNIDPYYPGDHYVDWVGVSLYTLPYSQGKEKLGANPIDLLKPIYEKYSHKPMMISETGIAHYSYENNKDYSRWASGQFGNLYGFLPKIFPQIKAITYYNHDKDWSNPNDVMENNYDIGTSDFIESTYERLIQNNYFIDHLTLDSSNNSVKTEYAPYGTFIDLTGEHNAFVYVKLPFGNQPHYVAVFQGDKKLAESYAQPWEMKLNFNQINKSQPLTVYAYDNNYKIITSKQLNIHTISKFKDVPINHYSESAINYLVDLGIISGIGNGNFGMGQPLTRWQAVLLLNRANKVSIDNRPDPGFIDVPQSHRYYREIAASVEEGIFEGIDASHFEPDKVLTRAQMAVLLQRLYQFPEATKSHPFTDLESGVWYSDAIVRLYNAGITNGVTATTFGPNATIQREQFAVFLHRAMLKK